MFEELNWDNERLAHIAEHNVEIGEVLEVVEGVFWSPKWQGTNAWCTGKQGVDVIC